MVYNFKIKYLPETGTQVGSRLKQKDFSFYLVTHSNLPHEHPKVIMLSL
jgi:hypothetical protein